MSPKSDEASAMSLPPLVDDLVEEVLLRFPPEYPASLVRAALVCWCWQRLVSDPGFHRRFRERHRAPPVLGFLANLPGPGVVAVARFVPTAASSVRARPCPGLRELDSRHGRVLFLHAAVEEKKRRLVVWDPVTDQQRDLPATTRPYLTSNWNAAVLCAAQGCRHLDGHFLVVMVGTVRADNGITSVRVYSSDTGSWSKPVLVSLPNHCFPSEASAVVSDVVCFKCRCGTRTRVLEYNVSTRQMYMIRLKPESVCWHNIRLVPSGDGWMEFANVVRSKLYMWLLEIVDTGEGKIKKVKSTVFDLDSLLPVEAVATQPQVASVADGAQVVFMRTSIGFFIVDLTSCQIKKVGEVQDFNGIVPYTSFCTPVDGSLIPQDTMY